MSITSRIARKLTPQVGSVAPGTSSAVVHRTLVRAIEGVGPLPGAVESAESQLDEDGVAALRAGRPVSKSELDAAVKGLIGSHLKLAATQGFVTNLGGLAAMAASVPANLAGLALVQTHLIAAIAHLGGHDLADPAVRDVVLVCLLGEDDVDALVEKGTLPGGPRALLAAAADSPGDAAALDRLIATEVTGSIVGRVSGRSLAGLVGRRVPVLGGIVGAGSDARSTKALGEYAARQLVG